MKIVISSIKVDERIRKEVTKISELAADIKKHGLLNPVTVVGGAGRRPRPYRRA